MPDQLNKQAIVNLLIDSPLREPIKINLIDIVNNTTEPDLPKVFPTIVKELEIFQKATERRMKLAEETIAKLGGIAPAPTLDDEGPAAPSSLPTPPLPPVPTPPLPPAAEPGLSVPPLDLPPMPTQPIQAPVPDMPPLTTPIAPIPTTIQPVAPSTSTMATMDTSIPPLSQPAPLSGATPSPQADEDALAEIQKELDSLKTATAADISTAAASPAPAAPQA